MKMTPEHERLIEAKKRSDAEEVALALHEIAAGLHEVASAIRSGAKEIGVGGAVAPSGAAMGGLELVAMEIRDGLSELTAAIDEASKDDDAP